MKQTILDYIDEVVERNLKKVKNKEKSRLGTMDFTHYDKYGTMVYCIAGGLNGRGSWSDYFSALAEFTSKMNSDADVKKTWLIKLENDCLDDVFYAYFGVCMNAVPDECIYKKREVIEELIDRRFSDYKKVCNGVDNFTSKDLFESSKDFEGETEIRLDDKRTIRCGSKFRKTFWSKNFLEEILDLESMWNSSHDDEV